MRRLLILVVGLVLVLVVASCGSATSTPTTSSTAPAAASTATSAPAAAGTQPATAAATTGATQAAATTPAATGATPVASADTTAINAAVDAVVTAIQQRDRDYLQNLLGGQLRQQIRSQDLDRLISCLQAGTTITRIDRQVQISGDTAKVTVTFQLTAADGTTKTVDRVWEFTRQSDGTWLLSTVPDCPFGS